RPSVLRPRAVRVAAYVTGVIVLAGMIGGAVVMPYFTIFGRLGLVAIGVAALLFCHLEASVHLVARTSTLEVRNLFSRRTLQWPEIIGVSFPMGDPWAHLNLADGTTLATMAIQRYDGKRAIAAAHRLEALIRQRGEAADAGFRGAGCAPRRSGRPAPRRGRPRGPLRACDPSWTVAPAARAARPAVRRGRPRTAHGGPRGPRPPR